MFDFELENEKPRNDLWNACGFETNNFIMNTGSIYLVLLFTVLSFIVQLVSCAICKSNKYCGRILKVFTNDLKWKKPIEFVVQSFTELAFAVILQTMRLNWNTKDLFLNNISFLIVLAIIIIYPIWLLIFLYRNYNKLNDEDFK